MEQPAWSSPRGACYDVPLHGNVKQEMAGYVAHHPFQTEGAKGHGDGHASRNRVCTKVEAGKHHLRKCVVQIKGVAFECGNKFPQNCQQKIKERERERERRERAREEREKAELCLSS